MHSCGCGTSGKHSHDNPKMREVISGIYEQGGNPLDPKNKKAQEFLEPGL